MAEGGKLIARSSEDLGPLAARDDRHGLGMADELGQYFHVVLFKDFDAIPSADLILIVKQRPPAAFVGAAKSRGARVCFAPVDVYQNQEEIAADARGRGAAGGPRHRNAKGASRTALGADPDSSSGDRGTVAGAVTKVGVATGSASLCSGRCSQPRSRASSAICQRSTPITSAVVR